MSSAQHYPPKAKTPRRKRGVFVLLFVCAGVVAAAQTQTVGDVYASDAAVKGSVRETPEGLEIGNGAAITAGEHSATLRLARGGQVRICPNTNITANISPKGQELMFAMSAGSLEAEYNLPFISDVVLTPDFRILISGPAAVDVSITATPNGDACVRSRGDDSYVVVSELMGDDFYHVKPEEQVVFHAGHVKDPEVSDAMSCGCRLPSPVQRAEAAPPAMPVQPPTAPPASSAAQTAPLASATPRMVAQPASSPAIAMPVATVPKPAATPEQKAAVATAIRNEPAVAAAANASAALPPQSTGPVQVEVDAPMIFKGTGGPPDVTATLARVHIERLPWPETPNVAPQPPQHSSKAKPQTETTPKKGFFHRLVRALFG
ncbi:MAG: hypothetical protein ACJ71Q_21535 [Terriglobales bacterium]